MMLGHNVKSLITIILLLLINIPCRSADAKLNGDWHVNTELSKETGFPGKAWDIISNKELIDAVKSMRISIDDTNVTMTVTSNGEAKTEHVSIIKRDENQIVIMGLSSRLSLISGVTEKTLVWESGQFFRVYFSKQ